LDVRIPSVAGHSSYNSLRFGGFSLWVCSSAPSSFSKTFLDDPKFRRLLRRFESVHLATNWNTLEVVKPVGLPYAALAGAEPSPIHPHFRALPRLQNQQDNMSHHRRLCSLVAAIGFFVVLSNKPASSSEAWTCFQVIKGEKYPFRYIVSDKTLLHGDGSSSSRILLNDDKLLISVTTFTSPNVRYPQNRDSVEIDDPHTMYFIMDKSRKRFITLESVITLLEGLTAPSMAIMNCVKDQP
jgi:hypothetical protein